MTDRNIDDIAYTISRLGHLTSISELNCAKGTVAAGLELGQFLCLFWCKRFFLANRIYYEANAVADSLYSSQIQPQAKGEGKKLHFRKAECI